MGCQSGYKFGISECCLISNYSLSAPTQISGTWIDEVANTEVIATGSQHSAAIKTDGTLWLWGSGNSGRLGDNTTLNKSSPVQTVSGGTNWCQVSIGGTFSAAIKTDGTLWTWGDGANGVLGDNTIIDRSSPVQTVSGGTNWKQVSAGSDHTGAIKTDGTLWMWGQSSNGRLGNNNTAVDISSPVQTVAGGNNWKQVSIGGTFSAAIKTDGTLWTWGDGANGVLGDNTIIDRSSPVQTVSGGTNWKQVSASKSEDNIAAIKTDGTLWLWGNGGSGRLGNNLTINQSSPVQTISGGTNWKEAQLTETAVAIKTDGTLWSWGRNLNGALGNGTEILSISSPVQISLGITDWRQISIASTTVLATRSNCTLYGWGSNSLGQLAFDLITNCGMQMKPYDFDDVFVRKEFFSEGGLWLWGCNAIGALGNNSTIDQSSPVQTVSGGTNWKQVNAYSRTTVAIKADGTLWSWGCGVSGILGNNATTDRSSPVQTVSGGNNWKQVSNGGYAKVTAAIKTDGSLWTWGLNSNGQLGNNAVTARSSPVQTVSAGTNWKQVNAGFYHIAAIKTDGTLWSWGCGVAGILGNNVVIDQSSPVQTVSAGTNWKQVSLGQHFSAAIKTDGTLWTWGCGASGRLGSNSTTNQSSPIQTISGGTNWKQVSAGYGHIASVKTDGSLWLWGSGSTGKLGNNNTINQSSPVQTVSGGTDWKQVSAGRTQTAAIKTNGTLWLWGQNTQGQLGTNERTNRSSPVQTISSGTSWLSVSTKSEVTAALREDCW